MNEPEIQSVPATITDEKSVVVTTQGTPRYLGRNQKCQYQSADTRMDGTGIGTLRHSYA